MYKYTMIRSKLLRIIFPLFFLLIVSCSKKGKDGNSPENLKIEVENADSVVVYPGYNRVKVSWKANSDIAKGIVANGQDSIVAILSGTSKMSAVVENLSEGNHTIYIYQYDNKGNRSSGYKLVVHVFGDNYVSNLSNRIIQAVSYNKEKGVYVAWGDPLSNGIGTKITYKNNNNDEKTVFIDKKTYDIFLKGYKEGSPFTYQTMYLPDSKAIDTFYAKNTVYSAAIKEVNYTTLIAHRIRNKSKITNEIYSDSEIKLTDGIVETTLYYSNLSGKPMHAFILSVDLSNPNISIEPTLANGGTTFSYQTVSEMAGHSDKPKHRVIGAINGDYFLYPPKPWNIVILNNVIIKDTWYTGAGSYLAILKDGSLHIGNEQDFDQMKSNIKDAIGGAWMVVKDHVVPTIGDVSVEPRTGIGYSDDKMVYFIVVDGRSASYSNGCTLSDLGEMFKAIGSQYAINLDGGGSSTFVTKKLDGTGWEVRNRPSDGKERAVINAWLAIARLD